VLLAVAETAVPAGRIFPAAGPRAIDGVEDFLAHAGAAFAHSYRAILLGIEATALLRHRRGFAALGADERLAVLESWSRADYPRRTALRALLAPIKVAHFDDPHMYHSIGCVYGRVQAVEPRPRWMQERVLAAGDVAGETLECDAVVIGTGAGGAVVGKELAEAGAAVVMLEEGHYHQRHEFNARSVEMQRLLYRDMGATFAFGNTAIFLPVGKSVGGSTTINSGTCYRVPERVLTTWREKHGLRDFTPERMAPYFERVEGVLQVGVPEPRHLGGVARLIARGCDALGYRHHPLRRNAPGCDGQGVCCFGCPTDAKRSTNVSYVPLALKAGATLVTGLRVERILVENGRAVGVVGSGRSSAPGRPAVEVTVRARSVVVSCGSLYTPLLLEKNGLAGRSGQLGRNLSIHPATGVAAIFDEPVDGAAAIPQGYAIEEFRDEGILFEGAFAPLDVTAATFNAVGPRFTEVLEAFDRLALFGFLIEDVSRGRVRRGPNGRPLITYIMKEEDVARIKRGVEILIGVFRAAGARRVLPLAHGHDEVVTDADFERFRRARLTARDFDLSAYHPLGTARMGIDPATSVIGPDHQAHDVPGLFVVDGSAVPSSLAVNPQVTIMAMATRAAELLAARLS
jgi:choline dehydrogenase-like flavoprotein